MSQITVPKFGAAPAVAGLPEDLSAGHARNVFLSLVYQAVHAVEWPRPVQSDPSARVLQTLLTYSYGVGIYSSREIEFATRSDKAARYICANHFPEADLIRRFRRSNKASLEQGLARLIELVSEQRQELCLYADWSRSGPAPLLSSIEAQRRLRRAIQADSMALDE